MLKFITSEFNELNTSSLYEFLSLRSEVFVVEQNCVYQDIDFKDQKATHVLGYKNNKLVAYARLFAPGDYFSKASIGRVIVKASERKYGYGHDLIKYCISIIEQHHNTTEIHISAQEYLEKFYKTHGFIQEGAPYLEDDIPHLKMIKK